MRNFFFLLLLIPCLNFSQSGISLSGMSQFNIGESIMPQNNSYIPVSYEQRNNNITISIFRGRRFRIGTFAIKGSVSYNIENTKYHGTKNIDDYKVTKRHLIPNLELWHILFQSKNAFLYASIGSYGIIQNLNTKEEKNLILENVVYEHNSIVPFLRTGIQLNYNRFFINPFVSFDLKAIRFNSFNDILNTNIKEKIKNHAVRTGLEFGIMF